MLTAEQMIPFLLHDDVLVREHAQRSLCRVRNPGNFTADHLWELADRFPNLADRADDLCRRPSAINNLQYAPQTVNSIRRLLQSAGKEDLDVTHVITPTLANMSLAIFSEHRDEFANHPAVNDSLRAHLAARLELMSLSPDQIWDQLQTAGLNDDVDESDKLSADRLIEAAARHVNVLFDRLMQELTYPTADGTMRSEYAMRVFAAAREEMAIPAILPKLLDEEPTFLTEAATRALGEIGTDEVVSQVERFVQKKSWGIRLSAVDPLSRINTVECEAALLRLAEAEHDENLRVFLLGHLCQIGSIAGLNLSRRAIKRAPTDPESLALVEELIAVSVMHGQALAEEDEWRRRLSDRDARQARFASSSGIEQLRELIRRMAVRSGSLTSEVDLLGQYVFDDPAMRARDSNPRQIVFEARIGRNDPCPCGSGKKHKKCCGR